MGKRPQPRLQIDALTGEWRNGEAGEGRGSEPCEPGGLRHQAGGASWRAPYQDPVGRISPGPNRWPPGAERHLVPAKSNLKPQNLDPAGVTIRYSMYEPGRTGKHEHPYYPLPHSCHTPEHRTQTLTCHDLNPDTAYILHYIYSYLTQGQPEQGLIAMSPQAKHIISKGIGVYATPVLQPTTPVAHLTTGLAIYTYLLMNPCPLQQASPADRLFFTDASAESALTPITGGGHAAANPHRGTLPHGPPHGPRHLRGLLPRGAGSHGRRNRRNRGPPTRQPPAHRPGLVRGRRHCRHTPTPLHSKTTSSQSHPNEPRHPGTAALESPSQPSPLRPTPHRETRVPQAPIRKW